MELRHCAEVRAWLLISILALISDRIREFGGALRSPDPSLVSHEVMTFTSHIKSQRTIG
jgi:hypothetical protein